MIHTIWLLTYIIPGAIGIGVAVAIIYLIFRPIGPHLKALRDENNRLKADVARLQMHNNFLFKDGDWGRDRMKKEIEKSRALEEKLQLLERDRNYR